MEHTDQDFILTEDCVSLTKPGLFFNAGTIVEYVIKTDNNTGKGFIQAKDTLGYTTEEFPMSILQVLNHKKAQAQNLVELDQDHQDQIYAGAKAKLEDLQNSRNVHITFDFKLYEEQDEIDIICNALKNYTKLQEIDSMVRRKMKDADNDELYQFCQMILEEIYD